MILFTNKKSIICNKKNIYFLQIKKVSFVIKKKVYFLQKKVPYVRVLLLLKIIPFFFTNDTFFYK